MLLLEIITVGLPFCSFKILAGLSLAESDTPFRALGIALICLGVLDGVINAVNLAGVLMKGRRLMPACVLGLSMRRLRNPASSPHKWHDLGNALDVLLSFALVASMIGFGRLRTLPPVQFAVWNISVILNVLGAGLGRFGDSLRNLSRDV